MKSRRIKNGIGRLTAKEVFEFYAGTDEKTFLSNFHYDNPPVTDIREMCRIYAMEIPGNEGLLFSLEELKNIESILLGHLENYIESKGGMDKVELYTREELDKIDEQDTEEVLDALANYYGLSREELSLALRKGRERKWIQADLLGVIWQKTWM